MATIYRLRFFFDPGSGICLWSANDSARERFGYPVDLSSLPLPEMVRRRGYFLLAWWDTFIDWGYPALSSQWRASEEAAFNAATQEFLALLREHLGPDFEVADESNTAARSGIA